MFVVSINLRKKESPHAWGKGSLGFIKAVTKTYTLYLCQLQLNTQCIVRCPEGIRSMPERPSTDSFNMFRILRYPSRHRAISKCL